MFTEIKSICNGIIYNDRLLFCECGRLIKNSYITKRQHENTVKHKNYLSKNKITKLNIYTNNNYVSFD